MARFVQGNGFLEFHFPDFYEFLKVGFGELHAAQRNSELGQEIGL
jgi:hypothetical protein